ncbi:MAG: ankyrin repeat domain-containing protein [Fimbriimonas sp.]
MLDLASLITEGDVGGVRALLDRNPEVLESAVPGAPSPLLLAVYYGKSDVAETIRRYRPQLTLHEAAATGDVDQLGTHLAAHPEMRDAFNADGFSPLGYAAFFNHPEAVRRLLAAGADPSLPSTNPMGVSPLHSALAGGHKELARQLIEAGADVSAASAAGWTPAHYVAEHGDVETARYLRERGAQTDLANGEGKTPADIARGHGHADLADFLAQ